MKSWSLQLRLLLITFVPVALLTIALSTYVVNARFHDMEDVQDQQAHLLLAKYRIAFDQLQSITPSSMQDLAVAALEEDSVRSLTLIDESGNSLAHSGPLHRPLDGNHPVALSHDLTRQEAKGSVLYVQELPRPVILPNSKISRAWLVLEMSESDLIIRRYETLMQMTLVTAVALGLLGFFIGRAVRRWLKPMQEMSEAIQQVDASHMEQRLETHAVGDLAALQDTINHMLDNLAEETEELKSSMTQANEDLRETLEVMEVQNIELTLARKEAVEGNRIKSEFLANISHEIRTPLNGIMGFAKLLLKTPLSPRQLDYVHTIQKSSDSLLAIINDVLDLSKIEAGKLVLDHTPLDIEEVIFEVLNMLAPLAEEKELEQVAFIYDDVPRHLMGDPLRFKQILTNLVNNAIKFTNEGEITVRAMLDDQNSQYAIIRISVTDTGIGLSETARADLFRAFSQGDPSTSRKFGGTGLGLVISKHLAEQMGGEINFDSTQDKGSTFWFTVKAELDHYAHAVTYDEPFDGRRLLVAESHHTSRQMLSNMLDNWGADVKAVDSIEAIRTALAEGQAFDAVICSLTMLEISEQQSSEFVQEIQSLYTGPLLLLTRNSDSSQEQALYQNRHVAVLSKPVYPRELHRQLQKLWTDVMQMTLPITAQPLTLPPSKVKVLAVDDNAANLRLVCTLLEDLHVEAVSASDGFRAIELAQRQNFDLIFMDIQMPGMTGLEATQKIRANETEGRRVPVIALTAHAMANERVSLLKSGMDDYVTKPIQETQLIHILSKYTRFKRPQGGTPTLVATTPAPESPAANSSAEDTQIVDWNEGLKLAAGKDDLARDMLSMLLNSLETEKHKIQGAFIANDIQALLSHVHYLHGATRYCGVPGLRDAAHALETEIKMLINLHKTHQAEGKDHGANHTRNCKGGLDVLMQRINELIEWRDRQGKVGT